MAQAATLKAEKAGETTVDLTAGKPGTGSSSGGSGSTGTGGNDGDQDKDPLG